jgi:hypothetical protein
MPGKGEGMSDGPRDSSNPLDSEEGGRALESSLHTFPSLRPSPGSHSLPLSV